MTPIESFLLFVAAPTVFLCSLLEAVVLSRRSNNYDWRAFGVSIFDFVLRIAVTILVPFTIAAPLVQWVIQHRLTTQQVDTWQAFALLFITLEFF